MPTDVTVAENVSAPAEVKQPESFAEELATWTPEQRTEWDKTGKEPEVKPATAAVVPVIEKAAPEKVEPVPATAAGENTDQDLEPEYLGTPEQIARQRHAYQKVIRQRTEARTEARLLREQLAERNKTATAAGPPAEAKPSPQISERPKRPKLKDFEGEDGLEKWEVAVEKYDEDIRQFDRQEAARERAENDKRESGKQKATTWASEVETAKKTHPDFEAVAFSPKVPASLPMIGVIMGMKGGTDVFYHLGGNLALATELTNLTDIPGDYATYEELAAAADKDPALARRLGAAEGIVRAEAKRILAGSSKPPDPQPVTVSQAAAPAARVDVSSSGPQKDALAEANRMYDLTGEHKYLTLINELEDKRDAERRKAAKRK